MGRCPTVTEVAAGPIRGPAGVVPASVQRSSRRRPKPAALPCCPVACTRSPQQKPWSVLRRPAGHRRLPAYPAALRPNGLPGGEGPIRPDGVVGLATRRWSAGSLAGLLSWMIQRLPLCRQLLPASTPSAPSSPTERGPCRSRQTGVPCSPPEGVPSGARVTTSSSTFGPGLPSPSPVPSMPFLTTSTACSACAVQVCCTLQPTMGFAWFPATPRGTPLSTPSPYPKVGVLCRPHGTSPLNFRPLQAAADFTSGSREASVAGRRRRTTGGGQDRSGAASEDGHHRGSRHDREHTVFNDQRSEDLSSRARRPGTRGSPMHQTNRVAPGSSDPPTFAVATQAPHREVGLNYRLIVLLRAIPTGASPFEAFPSAAAGVRVASAPALPSLRRRKRRR